MAKFLIFLLTALLVVATIADASAFSKKKGAPPAVQCTGVTDAVSGDTCSSLAETFNLSGKVFAALNPNLDCDNMFVGQWICIDGDANQ
ncbi:hypothetical protein ACHQM5_017751 [Ranunculus cassubicifolius]